MFKKIEITNIGPIKNLSLDLGLMASPILILGQNGAGKSTILDCLSYILSGEFPSKPTSIYNRVTWGEKEGKVKAIVSFNDNDYTIEKTINLESKRQTGKIWLNDKLIAGPLISETDKFLAENLVSPSLLLMTNFASQFKKGDFVQIDPYERKKVLAEMLNLGLSEHLPAFVNLKKDCDKEIIELEIKKNLLTAENDVVSEPELIGIKSELKKTNNALASLEHKKSELEQEEENLRKDFESYRIACEKLKTLKDVVSMYDNFANDHDISPDLVPLALNEAKEKRISYENKLNDNRKRNSEINISLAQISAKIDNCRKTTKQLDEVENTHDHYSECIFLQEALLAKKELEELEIELDKLSTEKLLVEEKILFNTVCLNQCNESFIRMSKAQMICENNPLLFKIEEVKKEIEVVEFTCGQNKIDDLQRRKDNLIESKTELKPAYNMLIQKSAELRERKGRIEFAIENFQIQEKERILVVQDLESLYKKQKALEIIVTAFGPKGIQPLMLELSIPEICQIANDLLSAMSDGTMRISIHTTKKVNQGKDLKETLIIEVSCADGRSGDIAEFSGGEQSMIATAIRCALALYNIRENEGMPFMVFDEPFGSFDPKNNYKAMCAFVELNKSLNQIIIVSHQSETFGQAGTIINLSNEDNSTVAVV